MAGLFIQTRTRRMPTTRKARPKLICSRGRSTIALQALPKGVLTKKVRALLIDKDRQPKWQFASIDAVPGDFVEHFFVAPWPENPLSDL
ncbi:MAG: enoyl-CoA hydratase/isomerase family protein [Gammaproteobacteria bacterium]|nr:enoyl-CoA hydratase/isomerase family protein [Gammaproteobacteria bacterium]NND38441.1 hypothetical protein [Pseudomonadales bacterium]